MGRIKNKRIKRSALELVGSNKGKFSKDFNENKKMVNELAEIQSKKIRNVLAGYITKLMKRNQ